MVKSGSEEFDQWLLRELEVLERSGMRRALVPLRHDDTTQALKHPVDFSSNDYLGLAGHPLIREAAVQVLRQQPIGAAAARLISGDDQWHHRLEDRLARLKETEAALLFPSGYAANTGAIPALARRSDVLYTDQLNHASLIDGCALARAETRIFPHLDLAALEEMLQQDRGRYRHRWIVVDGVFSMDGECFPLDRLVELARRWDAWTYVDDAHGSGVLGRTGRGSTEKFGVTGEIDVLMGTLGKAFGVVGGFVAGSNMLRDWLVSRARSFVYTTASPPALAAATLAAIELAEAEPWRRELLRRNARHIRQGLAGLGRSIPGDPDGHIIPVIIGGSAEVARIGAALKQRGLLVGVVRPPTVPRGSARLRITASAGHGDEQVNRLLEALEELLPHQPGE